VSSKADALFLPLDSTNGFPNSRKKAFDLVVFALMMYSVVKQNQNNTLTDEKMADYFEKERITPS